MSAAFLAAVARPVAATGVLVACMAGVVAGCAGDQGLRSDPQRMADEIATDRAMNQILAWPDGEEARETCARYASDPDPFVARVREWLKNPPEAVRDFGARVDHPDDPTIRRHMSAWCAGFGG